MIGREIAVDRRPLRRRAPEKRQVAVTVIADGIIVVHAGAQPAVARAAVVLDAAALERVIGIGVRAPLEIGGEGMRLLQVPIAVRVLQAGLPPVSAVQPSEQVIERAVLHHDDDDVIDPGGRGIDGQRARLLSNPSPPPHPPPTATANATVLISFAFMAGT